MCSSIEKCPFIRRSLNDVVACAERSPSFLGRVEGQIMTLIRPVQTWSFLLLIFRALFVQTVKERELSITEVSILPSQSSSFDNLNQTSLPSNISANKLAVFCDGHEYGRNLIAADCRDAITGIKRSTQRLSFRERSADPQTWDVGLPSRQIGGKDAAMGISSITGFRPDF